MDALPNLRLSVDDFEGIGRFALENGTLVVVGPELPLSWESDHLQRQGLWYSVPQEQERRLRRGLGQSSDGQQGSPRHELLSLRKRLRRNLCGSSGSAKSDGLAAGKV